MLLNPTVEFGIIDLAPFLNAMFTWLPGPLLSWFSSCLPGNSEGVGSFLVLIYCPQFYTLGCLWVCPWTAFQYTLISFGHLIQSCGFKYHIYADNVQICISTPDFSFPDTTYPFSYSTSPLRHDCRHIKHKFKTTFLTRPAPLIVFPSP